MSSGNSQEAAGGHDNIDSLAAEQLHQLTRVALARVGFPSWPALDDGDECERLVYWCDEEQGESFWALTTASVSDTSDDPAAADGSAELCELNPTMASCLIRSHLAAWLLDRGWQTQVEVSKRGHRWRLVDCLSFADGGGDRLDEDYPYGEDELSVLCEAIDVVARRAG